MGIKLAICHQRTLARLRNPNATDDGHIDFQKILYSKLGNKHKVADLLVQKLLNDITLD